MPVNPRTPVLVAHGQVNHREAAQDNTLEPVDLMAAAAREAAEARVLGAVDSIRVVNLLSVYYRDPALLLGQRLGIEEFTTRYSGIGGNVPQTLVNRACVDIQQGGADVVLVAGAEMWRTRTQLRAAGQRLTCTEQDDSIPQPEGSNENVPMAGESEIRIKLDRPAYIYPMFEQALRVSTGETVDDHRKRIGELWARFNEVAVQNPHAWIRKPVTAEEISQTGPTNRMISWPYTKLMNSNNMVDQGAALILTSVEAATRLGIANEQWVYPYAGTDAHDTYSISERAELHKSPAIRIGGTRALELAGFGIDDMDYVDLYSCFPSAVQIAANELGLPADDPARPLTVTGGLTFAGGPWNNYVAHSIASMAKLLTDNPGRHGLVTANGGYLTKHSFGVYGTEPPKTEFRWEDVQPAVEREPTRTAAVEWEGVGTIEAWTTPFDREGQPERAFLAVRTPDDRRTLALITDPDAAAATVQQDIGGAKVKVAGDGSATLQ
jgi:acetyl-CoA C-acetyltransferase